MLQLLSVDSPFNFYRQETLLELSPAIVWEGKYLMTCAMSEM